MKYNKIITLTELEHKPEVNMQVTDNLKVSTNRWVDPKILLPIVAKELSILMAGQYYTRQCPFRFIVKDKNKYIQFAEPSNGVYKLKESMIFRVSKNGNVNIRNKDFESGTFIYDLLDYFKIELSLLDENYTFKGDHVNYEASEIITEDYLKFNGFVFPEKKLKEECKNV